MMEREPITEPLESLKRTLTGHSRDWSKDEADAWLYGIVVGWGEGDALAEVAANHGWEPAEVERLKMLRAKFERLEAREGLPGDRFVCTPEQRATSTFLHAAEKAGWTKDQVIEAQRGDVERLYRAHVEALRAQPEPMRIDLPERVFSFARQMHANELEHLRGVLARDALTTAHRAKQETDVERKMAADIALPIHAAAVDAAMRAAVEHLRKAPETPPWTAEIGRDVFRQVFYSSDTDEGVELRRIVEARGTDWLADPRAVLEVALRIFGAIPQKLLPYLPSLIEKDATR